MKSLFSFLLLLLTGAAAHAQLEKGRHFLGGQTTLLTGDIYNTYLAINSTSPEKEYGINLVPTYGWAAARNWLIGVQTQIGYSHLHTSYSYPSSESNNYYYDLGVAPFTRLYLDIAAKGRFKIFGMAAVEFAWTKANTKDYQGNQVELWRNSAVHGTIGGGLAYFTKKDLSIDLNISAVGIRFGVYKAFGRIKGK
jgi:opacity protein-like surface antigen